MLVSSDAFPIPLFWFFNPLFIYFIAIISLEFWDFNLCFIFFSQVYLQRVGLNSIHGPVKLEKLVLTWYIAFCASLSCRTLESTQPTSGSAL